MIRAIIALLIAGSVLLWGYASYDAILFRHNPEATLFGTIVLAVTGALAFGVYGWWTWKFYEEDDMFMTKFMIGYAVFVLVITQLPR